MTQELKREFTLRISQANRTELTVIVYEMLLTYIEDALTAFQEEDKKEFRRCVSRARNCLKQLLSTLNFEYELAGNLMQLYIFANKELTLADIKYVKQPLETVRSIVTKLKDAYKEISKLDSSEPVMDNAQTVYAGLTYGKNSLNENLSGHTANRGFLV